MKYAKNQHVKKTEANILFVIVHECNHKSFWAGELFWNNGTTINISFTTHKGKT